jgi:hypothetical protein
MKHDAQLQDQDTNDLSLLSYLYILVIQLAVWLASLAAVGAWLRHAVMAVTVTMYARLTRTALAELLRQYHGRRYSQTTIVIFVFLPRFMSMVSAEKT